MSTIEKIQKVLMAAYKEGLDIKAISLDSNEFKWFKLEVKSQHVVYKNRYVSPIDDIDVKEVKLAGPSGYVIIRGEE